jgi:prenylcysteine oxidase/farnesylcysteine lyase
VYNNLCRCISRDETWISAQHYLKYTCAPKAYTQLRSATFLHEIRETNSKIPKTDGLETLVCMAIEGAMQIEGGNWQIFDNMLKFSNATILLNTTVNGVSKKNGRYSITTSSKDANLSNEESFDTVVLAAPFQYSGLQLEEGLLKHTPDNIPYVRLHVTLFTSTRTLNPLYFNLAPGEDTPTTILTTLRPDEIPEEGAGSTGFFSISTLRTLINPKSLEKEHLYKIFSPQKVTSEFLSDILAVPSVYLHRRFSHNTNHQN